MAIACSCLRILRIFACFAWTAFAQAEVVRIEIATTTPWLNGRSLGKAGPYEKLQGRVYFDLDPRSATGRRVTDINLAPRNTAGRVEFSSDFVLVRPRNPARVRNSVLLEIPNRGLTQANGSFFSTARGSTFNLMNLDSTTLSDAFIFEQGFTVAWLGWEFDLPPGDIRMEAPAANVNGPVRQSIVVTSPGKHIVPLDGPNSYCAADAAQPDAQLLVKSRFDDPGRILPRSSWAFARVEDGKFVPDPCSVVSGDEFIPGRIYDVIYRGTNPRLAGLGEAAVSDFVSWLKYGGVASPLREPNEVLSSHVFGYGYSQSGRFLRDFLYSGFNADEQGRPVFDGLFIASAGAGRGSFNHRYAMPGAAGNSVLSDLRPVDLFPFTDSSQEDPVTGARDGLLEQAELSHTVPRIFYTYTSTEYWARAGSLAYTTVDGTKELPIHDSARLYFYAGTPHASYPFPPIRNTFENYANFARADWSFRALLLDLDAWVTKATPPPDSAYPHLGADLVPRDRVGFPDIPGIRFPEYMPRNWRLDYGPDFLSSGIIANEPPKLGQPYKILVPRVDRDGNEAGGISLPEVAVPLGTFTGWNYQLPAMPDLDYLAGLVGSFIPFPPRSIAERYTNRDDYLDKIRKAAQNLVSRRLLRSEDINAILSESAVRWDYLTR